MVENYLSNSQSGSRLKVSISIKIIQPLFHDFIEHRVSVHLSHFCDDPRLTEVFTITQLLNTIVHIVDS